MDAQDPLALARNLRALGVWLQDATTVLEAAEKVKVEQPALLLEVDKLRVQTTAALADLTTVKQEIADLVASKLELVDEAAKSKSDLSAQLAEIQASILRAQDNAKQSIADAEGEAKDKIRELSASLTEKQLAHDKYVADLQAKVDRVKAQAQKILAGVE